MTAPDARQSDELRELIAETLRNLRDRDAVGYHGRSPGQVADAILPRVTAWAEKRERERAAEARAEVHYAGMQAVRAMPSDWYCPRSEAGRSRRDCPECVAEVALDAALAVAYGDSAAPSADDRTDPA